MILNGNQRGGWKDLARHLMKEENERVSVHEIRGFAAQNLAGALQESYAISRGTQCKQHLYSLSLSPPKEAKASVQDFEEAIERAEHDLGLTGQPRAIVLHDKRGADGALRRHAHAVWCRVDPAEMKAIPMSHDRRKLTDLSRDLYIQHGWTMPKGFVKSAWKDPATYSLAEWQQAKRAGRDAKDTKILFQDCWAISDSKAAFAAALKERGLILAQGDKRGYVAVDHQGEVYAIAKWTGQKTRAVRDRLGDQSALPNVRRAHEMAAKIITDRLHALKKEEQRAAAREREKIAAAKARQEAQHKRERAEQKALHASRQRSEQATRQARMRGGLWGLIDRISGKRRRQEEENREATRQARIRDEREKAELQTRQTAHQKRLLGKLSSLKQRRTETLRELRHDQKSLTRSAETKHTGTKDEYKRKRRTPTPDRPKRRSSRRPRDGPTPGR